MVEKFKETQMEGRRLLYLGIAACMLLLVMVICHAEPVFAKNSKPDSMPSRHTASAFIIAMAILRFNVWAGVAYLFIAVMISVSRVCAGVHYVRDVIVGAAIAILCGIVFLFLVF
jgi:membrane-associated phospholipid phosphatase